MSITTVLWDFGGVLTTSPFEAFNEFERRRGIPIDFIRSINATNPTTNAWALFESNTIDLETFDEAFALESAAAGHRIAGREVVALLSGALRPRMVAVLRRCRERHKIACITNNVDAGVGPTMSHDLAQAAAVREVMDLFECVVESSKEGVRKPDPKIYQLACERLNITPSEAVYLDDLGINLKPAKALGMTTIKVVTEDQAIADLEAALGTVLVTD